MRRITYTNWMSKIFKEITNGRGERVLENPAVQVLGAIFRKMNLVQKFLNKWTIFLFCSILFSSNQKEH